MLIPARLRTARIASFCAMMLLAASAPGQVVEVAFPSDGSSMQSRVVTDLASGLAVSLDNPHGQFAFPPDRIIFDLGGLFIDGGASPNLDITFSQDVRLIEYTIANDDTATFDLAQDDLVSAGQTVESESTFPFANTTDVFEGGVPIRLTSSDNDAFGFAISSVRVEVVPPPPCVGDLTSSTGFGFRDGQVDFGDFFALSFLVGPCGEGTVNPACEGDLAQSSGFGDPDGQIDFGDFFAMSFLVGPCP